MKKLRGEWDDYGRPAAIGEDKFDAAFSKVIAGEITPTELRKELGLSHTTFYRYRKKYWLNHKFCGISDSSRSSVGSYRIASERNIRHQDIRIPVCEES